eukprot:6211385-Pleurochrysis_carterae.AAC.1
MKPQETRLIYTFLSMVIRNAKQKSRSPIEDRGRGRMRLAGGLYSRATLRYSTHLPWRSARVYSAGSLLYGPSGQLLVGRGGCKDGR